MLWTLTSAKCHVNQFSELNHDEVLYDFDGPKIFTKMASNRLCLWYECAKDDANQVLRYLVAPTDDATIEGLKSGLRTVHDALEQSWLWVVDIDENERPVNVWLVPDLKMIPAYAKPEKVAFLQPNSNLSV